MEERWESVPGTNGKYEVSNLGRARGPRGPLTPAMSSKGYQRIGIYRDGQRVWRRLHRLVAMVFVPGYAPELLACHIDGDKTNNRADNLYWGTAADNAQDTVRHGTQWMLRRTHCNHGHPFTEDNVSYAKGYRSCLVCRRVRRD